MTAPNVTTKPRSGPKASEGMPKDTAAAITDAGRPGPLRLPPHRRFSGTSFSVANFSAGPLKYVIPSDRNPCGPLRYAEVVRMSEGGSLRLPRMMS
jgi:hypothetical protein